MHSSDSTLTGIAQSTRVGVTVLRIKFDTDFLPGAVAEIGTVRVR